MDVYARSRCPILRVKDSCPKHYRDGKGSSHCDDMYCPHDFYKPRRLILAVVLWGMHVCVRLWEGLLETPSEKVSNYGVNGREAGPAEVVECKDNVGPLSYKDEVLPSCWVVRLLALNCVDN